MSSRRHSSERPSGRTCSRWFGQISRVRPNQNAERPARTRPLSGISVGRTTSKTEMRSLATRRSRSSSSAYSSRTFPLATWTASDMHGLLSERAQALEHGVDMAREGGQIEDGVEVHAPRDLGVLSYDVAEVALFLRGAHRAPLDEAVGLAALEAGVDQRE